MSAATKVDVPDAVAAVDELLDGVVGNVPTVAQVDIVQILSETGNRVDSGIGDISAFCQDEIAQTRGNIDDLLHGTIGQAHARGEIEDPQVLKDPFGWQGKECGIINKLAVSETKFAQRLALSQEFRDGLVGDESALVEVNFQDIRAVPSKGEDGIVSELHAVVQFDLGCQQGEESEIGIGMGIGTYSLDIFAALGQLHHALVGDPGAARNVEALQPFAVLAIAKIVDSVIWSSPETSRASR